MPDSLCTASTITICHGPAGPGAGCDGFERVVKLRRQVGSWLGESDGAAVAVELCEAVLFRCADAGEEVSEAWDKPAAVLGGVRD